MPDTLPVLGSEGWLQDPNRIMTRLFTDMFLTDFSQSNIYYGQVMSLQYYLTTIGADPLQLTTAVEDAMSRYYSRFFKAPRCSFTHVRDEGSEMVFDVMVEGYKDGIRYDLNRRLLTDTSTGTRRFIEAFNHTGDVK